jgi:hypothetical protein
MRAIQHFIPINQSDGRQVAEHWGPGTKLVKQSHWITLKTKRDQNGRQREKGQKQARRAEKEQAQTEGKTEAKKR